MRKNNWKYVLLGVVFILLLWIYVSKTGYSQIEIKLPLQSGSKASFDLKIEKTCIYKVGIGLYSNRKNNKYAHIHDVFGFDSYDKKFPLNLEIDIKNKEKRTVYKKIIDDGVVRGTASSEDRIKFIFAYIELKPDVYKVEIIENDVSNNLAGLDAYFFSEQFYNVKCK